MLTTIGRVAAICACACLALVLGCNQSSGSPVSKAVADRIYSGMTEKEVVEILGPATSSAEISTAGALGDLKLPGGVEVPKNVRQSVWQDGGKVITVTFADGKVVSCLYTVSGPATSQTSQAPAKPDHSSEITDLPFTQTGSFTVIKEQTGPVNFPIPYAIAPNVELSGSDQGTVLISSIKPTGFEWKGIGEPHFGGAITWTAKGVKATKLPEESAK